MEARVNLVGYPGCTFHGVVQGIAWSVLSPSGQATGLLPKIDPTLNWARLAQRIPVRIILEECLRSPVPRYARALAQVGQQTRAAKARTPRIDKKPAVTGICG